MRSTEKYAEGIIGKAGLEKPSNAALAEIAEQLFQEFQRTGLDVSLPFFKKAHRWFLLFTQTLHFNYISHYLIFNFYML